VRDDSGVDISRGPGRAGQRSRAAYEADAFADPTLKTAWQRSISKGVYHTAAAEKALLSEERTRYFPSRHGGQTSMPLLLGRFSAHVLQCTARSC
jgi:hypothetical protein